MGEIVNLKRARKQRALAAGRQAAAENRVLHGRTSGEKQGDAIEKARNAARVDQAWQERPEET